MKKSMHAIVFSMLAWAIIASAQASIFLIKVKSHGGKIEYVVKGLPKGGMQTIDQIANMHAEGSAGINVHIFPEKNIQICDMSPLFDALLKAGFEKATICMEVPNILNNDINASKFQTFIKLFVDLKKTEVYTVDTTKLVPEPSDG